jgi:hypothetical protein
MATPMPPAELACGVVVLVITALGEGNVGAGFGGYSSGMGFGG